jgi:hypothetical protein
MVKRIVLGGVTVSSLVIGVPLVIFGISRMMEHHVSSCPACDAMGGLFAAIFAGVGFLCLLVGAVCMIVLWVLRARRK